MTTPAIFLSAASDDLKEGRDLLHRAFERAGCKVFTQSQSFGASAGNVLRLLRQHLDKSDYVIHLAGTAYGSEPEQPAFADHPDFKCSYTQFEYYYAHQQSKKVIAFVCAADFPYLKFTEKGATTPTASAAGCSSWPTATGRPEADSRARLWKVFRTVRSAR